MKAWSEDRYEIINMDLWVNYHISRKSHTPVVLIFHYNYAVALSSVVVGSSDPNGITAIYIFADSLSVGGKKPLGIFDSYEIS